MTLDSVNVFLTRENATQANTLSHEITKIREEKINKITSKQSKPLKFLMTEVGNYNDFFSLLPFVDISKSTATTKKA